MLLEIFFFDETNYCYFKTRKKKKLRMLKKLAEFDFKKQTRKRLK
jgi:hypothetical protein